VTLCVEMLVERVLQLADFDDSESARQNRSHRLLSLYLYQLASLASLCPRPGCEMQGSSPLGVDAVEKGLEIGDEQ